MIHNRHCCTLGYEYCKIRPSENKEIPRPGEIGVMYRTAVQVISFVIGAIANYKHIFFTFTMISFKMDGNVFFLNLSSVTWDY